MPDNAPDLLFYADAAGGLIAEIGWVPPEAVFAPHAETPHALWLDSSHDAHAVAREGLGRESARIHRRRARVGVDSL